MDLRGDQRGLTLLELMVALAGLAVLGLALSAMVTASGQAWASRSDHEAQGRSFRVLSARLHAWLRGARRVVAVHEVGGRVDVVVWADDDHQPGQVNLSELMLLRWEGGAGTVDFYQAEVSERVLGSPLANPAFEPSGVADPGFAEQFTALGNVRRYRVAENVEQFEATAARREGGVAFDHLEIVMTAADAGAASERVTAIAATLRAPDEVLAFTEAPDHGGDGDDGDDDERARDDDDRGDDGERGDEGDEEEDDDRSRGRGRGDDDDDDDRGRGRDDDDDDDDDEEDEEEDDDDRGRGRGGEGGKGRGGRPLLAPGGNPFD